MAKETMKAVIFKGPHEVIIEDRPVPKIQDGKDIIVKVEYSALCGRYADFSYFQLFSKLIPPLPRNICYQIYVRKAVRPQFFYPQKTFR
jgi:threonine dehydrogenase-like Zn-dependent dehydrogenase